MVGENRVGYWRAWGVGRGPGVVRALAAAGRRVAWKNQWVKRQNVPEVRYDRMSGLVLHKRARVSDC